MRFRLLSLVALTTLAVTVSAQRSTLQDRVERYGRDLVTTFRAEHPRIEFRELCATSNAIVIATVSRGVAFVNNDIDPQLHTDYYVTIQQVLRATGGVRLKQGQEIIVRRGGGATTIGAYNVVITEQDFPPFNAGETYVLFLDRGTNDQFFKVRYGGQGAFITSPDGVRQVSVVRGDWNTRKGVLPVQSFVAEIKDALAQR